MFNEIIKCSFLSVRKERKEACSLKRITKIMLRYATTK